MFNGEYRFYQSGRLLGVSKNLITTAGKAHVLKYMAGAAAQIGDSIAVGVGEDPATVNDLRLSYEVDAQTLSQIGVNTADSKLVFKASLLPSIAVRISEVGLWVLKTTASGGNTSRSLISADPVTETWLGASWDSTSRISSESLLLTPSQSLFESAKMTTFNQNLNGYSNSDEFVIAYEAVSNVDSMVINFYTTEQDYFSATFTNTGTGYKIARLLKDSCTSSGAPLWSNIEYISVGAWASSAGPGVARFDGLRIERNTNIDSASVLISRSKLAVPILKAAAEPLDIEYTMGFNL